MENLNEPFLVNMVPIWKEAQKTFVKASLGPFLDYDFITEMSLFLDQRFVESDPSEAAEYSFAVY